MALIVMRKILRSLPGLCVLGIHMRASLWNSACQEKSSTSGLAKSDVTCLFVSVVIHLHLHDCESMMSYRVIIKRIHECTIKRILNSQISKLPNSTGQLVDADLNMSERQSLHWTAGCEKHMQNGWTGPGEKEWTFYMWKQTQANKYTKGVYKITIL